MKRWITAAIMLAVVNTAFAEHPDRPFVVFQYGHFSCGEWAEARKSNSSEVQWAYLWFQGYASGSNAHSPDSIPGPLPDVPSFGLYIDNYCNAHPLDFFMSAAFKLADELSVKNIVEPQKKKSK